MTRLVRRSVIVAALLVSCTGNHPRESTLFAKDCFSGLQLCADEGLIRAKVFVRTCDPTDTCSTTPLLHSAPYLGLVELDAPPGKGCGPGDCGASIDALQQGWAPGRWKVVAPAIDNLEPPEPMIIDLSAGEILDLDLIYEGKG